FQGAAHFTAASIPATGMAGDRVDAHLVWQPLVAHPQPRQGSLQLDNPTAGDGTLWGNGTLDLYPTSGWPPDELRVAGRPISTDPTAIPQPYRVTLGVSPTRPNAPPDLASWQGAPTDRVPVASVSLTLGSTQAAPPLPADMHALEGPPLVGGGLELIA